MKFVRQRLNYQLRNGLQLVGIVGVVHLIPVILSAGGCFPPPLVDHAMTSYDPASRTVTYECLPGFRFVSGKTSVSLSCLVNRNWDYGKLEKCSGNNATVVCKVVIFIKTAVSPNFTVNSYISR